eukprot:TRINITY_DN30451_c0_g1_i1.p1 TRINITY_DN30451_c0_g1~~TRINITY_DN30451_c0_g1_i1.p1  ORF type:complete len:229 (+),score=48.38 TRINITY_DN30451_c0_g1_i1:247-933(+)
MLPPQWLTTSKSILIVGAPNSGKTTCLREFARLLSSDMSRVVVVVDKTNEIAGASDEPHAAIGSARWQPVDSSDRLHEYMRLAVENMSPSTVIVDEISTVQQCAAARTISQRGVQLIATVHGKSMVDLLLDNERSALLGGITSVTLSDTAASKRADGAKQAQVRKFEPVFDVIVELRQRDEWVLHTDLKRLVDNYLRGDSTAAVRLLSGVSEPVVAIPLESSFEYRST